MNVKAGYKSVEMWVTLLSTTLLAAWPAFPQSAFLSVIAWAGGRSAQKMFGLVDSKVDKPSWKTSEFWISIVFAILVTVFPDLPPEALYAVMGWTGTRTVVKLTAAVKNGK